MAKKRPSAVSAKRQATRDERAALSSGKKSERAQLDAALKAAAGVTDGAARVGDSFQNFGLALGMGTQNALSGSTYGFNPITRVRTLVEWIYRGTWIGGVAVDLRAEDMTREGIQVNSTLPPDDVEKLTTSLTRKGFWRGCRNTKRWANLYGGAIGVLLIDGQDLADPLRVETIGRGQFKGMAVLDRWMVEPTITAGGLVEELGPKLGQPKFYNVRSDSSVFPAGKIHYSRVLRLLGDEMPHWQAVMENMWGTSVYERIYDRLVAFDSATQGAAQTVYKSYIRTYKIEKLRELVTTGGKAYEGLLRYVQMMRTFQGIEGVTLIDSKDEFVVQTPTITPGVSEALVQFGQQICGALRVPAVRLFGMSPAGMNSTGDSDWRNYYDGVREDQESDLREFVDLALNINARSEGIKLPDGFGFAFTPLWQMTSQQKAEVADRKVDSVIKAKEASLIGGATALKELRQQSHETGVFTNITDDDIKEAEEQDDLEPPGLEGLLGGAPGPGGQTSGEEGEEATQTRGLAVPKSVPGVREPRPKVAPKTNGAGGADEGGIGR